MDFNDITEKKGRLDQLALLESKLHRAEDLGYIQSLHENNSSLSKLSLNKNVTPVLRDRLFRLGYLKTLKGNSNGNDLSLAVKNLQTEAGLVVDGWIGMKTWTSLQELFTFEVNSNLQKWNTDKPCKFMLRAIELRLITFGFLKERSRVTRGPIKDALDNWKEVLIFLEINEQEITSNVAIKWLFQIDTIISTVASKNLRNIKSIPPKVKHFLSCLLKIELWLHGYSQIKPNGKPLILRRTKSHRSSFYKYSNNYITLRKFWSDTGINKSHSNETSMILRSLTFLADESHSESLQSHRIEYISGQISKNIESAKIEWESQNSWGGRIWDGMKRIWKVIKTWVNQELKSRLKLIVRSAKQIASDSLTVLKRTFNILGDGFYLLIKQEVKWSNQYIRAGHDSDFDFKVFISNSAKKHHVDTFYKNLFEQIVKLKAAIGLSKIAIKVMTSLVSLTTTGWSWWRVIKLLLNFGQEIGEETIETIAAAY